MDHTYLFSLYTLLFCGFCKTDLYFLQIEISAQNDTALSYVFCHIHSHCLLQIQIPLAFGKWLICGFCLSPFLFFKLHFPNKTHYMLSQFPCKRPSWFCTAGAELVSPLQVCDFPKNPKIRVIHEPLVSLWDLWVRHPMSLSALLDLRSLKALIDDSKRLLLSCFFFFFFEFLKSAPWHRKLIICFLAHLSLCLLRQPDSVPAGLLLPPGIDMREETKMLCDPVWKGVLTW